MEAFLNQSRMFLKVAESNIATPKRPYKLHFYVTDKCNFKCNMCNIWRKPTDGELSEEEIALFFKNNNYFSWIDITGGEIFLRKDIEHIFHQMIGECKHLCFIHFPTNGFLTKRIVSCVENMNKQFSGKIVITISIDGPKEKHELIRGVSSWDRAIETFKSLEKINPGNNFFGMTLSLHNADMVEQTYQALRAEIPSLSPNKVHLNVAHASAHYYSNEKLEFRADKEALVKGIDVLMKKRHFEFSPFFAVEHEFLSLLKKYVLDGKHPLKRCSALTSTITVNPRGEVYPCLFFDRKLGSLRETNFELMPILEGEDAQAIKKNILDHCPHCWSACEAYPSLLANIVR